MTELGRLIEEDKKLWIPSWLERADSWESDPTDELAEPEDAEDPLPINLPNREVEPATEEELRQLIESQGQAIEPEIAREERLPEQERIESYIDKHPTHFSFRADVARAVNRVQAKFPWRTFANTYYKHPPMYGRKYEFVSVDYWGGGLVNGRYAGYRGKAISTEFGHRVFNAIFRDPYRPNIYWIIWNGRMWTRGYGWGPAPAGEVDSDAGHFKHIHVTFLL